ANDVNPIENNIPNNINNIKNISNSIAIQLLNITNIFLEYEKISEHKILH
ncbi:26880_t:CDS:1, partial [Racocetra persica]